MSENNTKERTDLIDVYNCRRHRVAYLQLELLKISAVRIMWGLVGDDLN